MDKLFEKFDSSMYTETTNMCTELSIVSLQTNLFAKKKKLRYHSLKNISGLYELACNVYIILLPRLIFIFSTVLMIANYPRN